MVLGLEMALSRENRKLHALIPGGAHTYSRGDDQFPPNAPSLLARGAGAYVWDSRGSRFLDYGMGLRSVGLGYANPRVERDVIRALGMGNNLTRSSVIELQAAERMVEIFDSMDMVKFAKNGSTVTSAAIRLARAATGRQKIAVCRQHPFHSFDDWFISSTEISRGIPQSTAEQIYKFDYGDSAQVHHLLNSREFAAVILEPATTSSPCMDPSCAGRCPRECASCPFGSRNFLRNVRQACDKSGTIMVLDEVITGFRWDMKGAQHLFQVVPDLTTVGKAIGNGIAVSALGGRRDLMDLGTILKEGHERLFLLSSTHGPEMIGCAAFLAVAEIYEERDVCAHLWSYGQKFRHLWNHAAKDAGLSEFVELVGSDISLSMRFGDYSVGDSPYMRTIFSYEMVEKGVLLPWISPSLSHGQEELDITAEALRHAFHVYADVLLGKPHSVEKRQSVKPVFRKYN